MWNYIPTPLTTVTPLRIRERRRRYMKSHRKELVSNTKSRRAIINITEEVQQTINESEVQEGLALINAVHITAVVFINMMRLGCTTILRSRWRSLPRRSRTPNTSTMALRTTPTPP